MEYKEKMYSNLYYLVFCIALLPILFLRDFTPSNELRYLSIADEAIRNHTFFTFTNHGVVYADKPPLFFWFVMLGKWLLGSHQMWFLSLISLVPALVIVRTMDQWIKSETDWQSRNVAQMMLLTTGLFAGLIITLRMDMLMCMFIVLALRAFHRMYSSPDVDKRAAWLFPVYIFLAVFSKGMVGLLVPLCSTFAFLLWTGRIRQFGKYWGWRTWSVLIFGFLLWFSAVYAESGYDYLNNLIFHQTIGRTFNSFHHRAPFYYYGISVWYSIAPWTLLVIGLLVAAAVRKLFSTDLQRLFCSVFFSTFIILSCISSKLQVYLLPAFAFMIYLAAMYLQRFKQAPWLHVIFVITAAIFVVVLPAALFVLSLESMTYLRHAAVYAAATVMTLCGLWALWSHFWLRRDLISNIRVLAIGLTCTLFIGGWVFPAINPWIGYKALCQASLDMAKEKMTDNIAVWGVKRSENMDVYLGRPVNVIETPDVENVRSHHRTVLMVRQRDLKYFEKEKASLVGSFAVVYLE
jgi:4-amino-4-deoxy-L-arabinose transferase-like glycosyltransferase